MRAIGLCSPIEPNLHSGEAEPKTSGHHRLARKLSGETGIRTLDTLAGMPVFKTGALNRSAISPGGTFDACLTLRGWLSAVKFSQVVSRAVSSLKGSQMYPL